VSDSLLATKIHIPPVHGQLVNRQGLLQRLSDGLEQGCRLTLISAPAGYGKSTLLSEWASQAGLPVAWLSLETGENAPARFWHYFAAALATIPHFHQAGINQPFVQALQSPRPPAMETLLADLLNGLVTCPERAALVLDDLHAITEGQIHQDLCFLIEHLPRTPASLHLVVASRRDPPWPLARWRARAELNELRPADLRFSHEETGQFLNRVLQLGLSPQDIAALQDRTEGWIAGLQMAALSMQARLKAQGAPGVSHFIETFTGSHRFILDYLMEEVIGQQPAELRDFLQETSILAHLTAPLCDALTGRQDSQAVLEQVEQANLFLIPLDDERQWYRYHHLFAELLRKRLAQARPDHIRELHRRASRWYAEHDLLSEAIGHALEAGDVQLVNELVSGNALAMIAQAELLDVLRHFEAMPAQHIAAKPWLGVAYAWVKAYVDPSAEMDRILQRVEGRLAGIADAREWQHLASHLAAIRAYVAWVRGQSDKALEFAREALENLPEDDWITRSHVLNIKGLALQYIGDLVGAVQAFEAAIASGQRTGRTQEAFYAYTNLAYVKLLRGGLHQAFAHCQHVLSLADEAGQVSKGLPVLAYAYATLSIVQTEWNEVESAIANARQGVALAEQWNQADALHFALTCLAEALCAAGDLEGAFAANRRAMQLAANVSPWYYRISACDEIEFNLAKGDLSAAAHGLAELEPLVDERSKRGKFLVSKAALLTAQGCFREAMMALEEAIQEKERRGEQWVLMDLLPLQALALQALGREKEALDVIVHCLTLAAPEGYVRIFVDRGAPMLRFLQIALAKGIQTEYINRLLPAFDLLTAPGIPGRLPARGAQRTRAPGAAPAG
jgi:LuxR family maltose regulon positive regulatory protein